MMQYARAVAATCNRILYYMHTATALHTYTVHLFLTIMAAPLIPLREIIESM